MALVDPFVVTVLTANGDRHPVPFDGRRSMSGGFGMLADA